MARKILKPGDLVIYCDHDQVSWGPWEVSNVSGDMVTLVVDNVIHCPAKLTNLRKVNGHTRRVAAA